VGNDQRPPMDENTHPVYGRATSGSVAIVAGVLGRGSSRSIPLPDYLTIEPFMKCGDYMAGGQHRKRMLSAAAERMDGRQLWSYRRGSALN